MSPITFTFKRIRQFIGILMLTLPALVFAQPGALDPSFNGGGIVTTDVGPGNDRSFSVIQQLDAKLVVCGQSFNGGNTDFAVTRYNPDGSLDPSFGLGGIITTPVGANESGQQAILQPDGKILVTGFTTLATQDFAIIRYHPNGNLDASFGAGGITTVPVGTGNDAAFSVAIQPDGKVVIAGGTTGPTTGDFAVIRLDSSGVLDPTFDLDGIVSTDIGGQDIGRFVAIQNDGRIVVTGWGGTGTNIDIITVRYMNNGALDPTWDGDGIAITPVFGANDQAFSLAIQPDDKILVSGLTYNGSDSDIVVVRYLVTGALDGSFGVGGIVTTDFPNNDSEQGYSIAIAADDKILVAGQTFSGVNRDFALVRYNPDGSLDNSFDGDGRVSTDLPGANNDVGWAVEIQNDERVVVAGSNNLSGSSTFGVARYLICEIVDTSLTFVSADSSLTANGSGISYQWVNCDTSFSIIPSETSQSYLITANGSFAVIITTTSNCADTSSCFTIMNLSNENYAFENTIMVFPNPSNGPLWLATEKPLNDATFNLVSLTGQILMTKTNITGYKASIDISSQANGIYILEIIDNGKVAKLKVVKQ